MARALAGSGSVRTRGVQALMAIDERANEGGAVAATGHVRLADELIDAARARRMDAEPVIRPRRLIVTLKIGKGPPVDRYEELAHCRLLEVLAHQPELLVGIAPPLGDVWRGQPTAHQRQVG